MSLTKKVDKLSDLKKYMLWGLLPEDSHTIKSLYADVAGYLNWFMYDEDIAEALADFDAALGDLLSRGLVSLFHETDYGYVALTEKGRKWAKKVEELFAEEDDSDEDDDSGEDDAESGAFEGCGCPFCESVADPAEDFDSEDDDEEEEESEDDEDIPDANSTIAIGVIPVAQYALYPDGHRVFVGYKFPEVVPSMGIRLPNVQGAATEGTGVGNLHVTCHKHHC